MDNLETNKEINPIPYFVGSLENNKVLMDLLIKEKNVSNSNYYYGVDLSSVYFICGNEVRRLNKSVFEFFVRQGLNVVEIKAPNYTKILNISTLIAANSISKKFYLKEDGKYMEVKLLGITFLDENSDNCLTIKVKRSKDWEVLHVDINKVELYYD